MSNSLHGTSESPLDPHVGGLHEPQPPQSVEGTYVGKVTARGKHDIPDALTASLAKGSEPEEVKTKPPESRKMRAIVEFSEKEIKKYQKDLDKERAKSEPNQNLIQKYEAAIKTAEKTVAYYRGQMGSPRTKEKTAKVGLPVITKEKAIDIWSRTVPGLAIRAAYQGGRKATSVAKNYFEKSEKPQQVNLKLLKENLDSANREADVLLKEILKDGVPENATKRTQQLQSKAQDFEQALGRVFASKQGFEEKENYDFYKAMKDDLEKLQDQTAHVINVISEIK